MNDAVLFAVECEDTIAAEEIIAIEESDVQQILPTVESFSPEYREIDNWQPVNDAVLFAAESNYSSEVESQETGSVEETSGSEESDVSEEPDLTAQAEALMPDLMKVLGQIFGKIDTKVTEEIIDSIRSASSDDDSASWRHRPIPYNTRLVFGSVENSFLVPVTRDPLPPGSDKVRKFLFYLICSVSFAIKCQVLVSDLVQRE